VALSLVAVDLELKTRCPSLVSFCHRVDDVVRQIDHGEPRLHEDIEPDR
jgi:hypothetical protein